jgi:capsular exopolysaccharide synthesis family protein
VIGKSIEAPRRLRVRAPGGAVSSRRLRVAPGVTDMWSRFLIARLMWILLMTILATASAGGYLLMHKPIYKSQATVAIYPAAGASSAVQPFVMGTEKGVVSSGAVLSLASQSLLIPVARLQSGLSVTVPVSSDLLVIAYTDPNPQVAQSVAEAIAQAYVAYRTTSLGPAPVKTGTSSTATLQAAVVTDATLPASPDGPDPLLTIGVALVAGLSLGIGLALLLDWLDDALRGAADLEVQSNAPVLAQIPAFDRNRRRMANGLIVVEHPESSIAGAYRDLRTRVLQTALMRQAKTLLVASPNREDKTIVAANLAAAIALSGRRTILISADLCEGHAHSWFGLEDGPGVTSVVRGEAQLADALATTDVQGLEVLRCGPSVSDPSAVLQSHAFHVLLTMLRTGADLVIIDAPPVLAGADAAALAESADMILLVADARITTRAEVRAAAQELQGVRDRLIGCVLDSVGRSHRLPSTESSRADDAPVPEAPVAAPEEVVDGHIEGSLNGNGHNGSVADSEELFDLIVAAGSPEAGYVHRDIPETHETSPTHGNGDLSRLADTHESSSLVVAVAGQEADLATTPAIDALPQTPVKTKRRRNQGRRQA